MIQLQILDNDVEAVQRYITFGREQLNLTIRVQKNFPPSLHSPERPLSSTLDKRIRTSPTIHTDKARKLKSAMEAIGSLIDDEKKHWSTDKAREHYFSTKAHTE